MFYLLFKRNSKGKALRVVLFYILYCIANEGLSFYLQSIQSESFVFLLYSFTVVEYSFFCYFLYLILPKRTIRKLIPFIWIGFIVFALIDSVFINGDVGFDSFTSGIESIIIILLSIYYLYIQLKGSTNLTIYSTFNFWVVIAFLIYFCGTFFLYLMTDSMHHNVSFQKQYFIINIAFNILKNILLCIAVTMKLNDTVDQQKSVIPYLDDKLLFREQI